MKNIYFVALLPFFLNGCFSTPAIEVKNICNVMDEKVSWYQALKNSEEKYNAPKSVQLAIIYQESHFASDAKPPRNKLFGLVPWTRSSSSYGFSQAKKATWDWYKLKTGNQDAKRDNFADSVDFVAWYMNQSLIRSNISKTDAYNQYLAYHEGQNGFNQKSYKSKNWLIKVARQVDNNAKKYKKQLSQCSEQLDNNYSWRLF